MNEIIELEKYLDGMTKKEFTQLKRRRLHDIASAILSRCPIEYFDKYINCFLENEKYVEDGK